MVEPARGGANGKNFGHAGQITMHSILKTYWLAVIFGMLPLLAPADVLVSTNGERFVGTVIAETSTNVVFDSNLPGG